MIIHYGIGRDYLPKWTLQEALREIFQNFKDFGDYNIQIDETKRGRYIVTISNEYNPENLEFLKIGNSVKHKENSIGQYGEGLKMALLIFLREELKIDILTNKYTLYPSFMNQYGVGETLCIHAEELTYNEFDGFSICFEIPMSEYQKFIDNMITDEDIIFSNNYYGDIVDKPKGNIYVGGLYVCNEKNLKNSYNLRPQHIPLDRDRNMTRSFEISYYSSKVLEDYKHFNAIDTTYSDTQFVDNVSNEFAEQFTPTIVQDKIKFTYKDETGEIQVLSNDNIEKAVKKTGIFDSIIMKFKQAIFKAIGLEELLLKFRDKYISKGSEMEQDFNVIIERFKSDKNG